MIFSNLPGASATFELMGDSVSDGGAWVPLLTVAGKGWDFLILHLLFFMFVYKCLYFRTEYFCGGIPGRNSVLWFHRLGLHVQG